MNKAKKTIAIVSVLVVLLAAGYAVTYSYLKNTPTYDGSETDVRELYNDPKSYDISHPDGVAEIIVQENLDKTKAANYVSAVVFDWRGFDTIGESFVLLTAIAGSFAILAVHRKKMKTVQAEAEQAETEPTETEGGNDEI